MPRAEIQEHTGRTGARVGEVWIECGDGGVRCGGGEGYCREGEACWGVGAGVHEDVQGGGVEDGSQEWADTGTTDFSYMVVCAL